MSITLGAATKLLDDMMINDSEWHTERTPQGKKVNSVEETSSLGDKIDAIMSMLANGRSHIDPNNVPLASLVAQEENVDVNFIKSNNFNNNAYRNNYGNNNYRPYPSNNGSGYGNSYNNNKSVPSGLEVMLKEFISTQTAFNKTVEEKLGKIDVLASKVDSLALDVDLLKLKVMPEEVKDARDATGESSTTWCHDTPLVRITQPPDLLFHNKAATGFAPPRQGRRRMPPPRQPPSPDSALYGLLLRQEQRHQQDLFLDLNPKSQVANVTGYLILVSMGPDIIWCWGIIRWSGIMSLYCCVSANSVRRGAPCRSTAAPSVPSASGSQIVPVVNVEDDAEIGDQSPEDDEDELMFPELVDRCSKQAMEDQYMEDIAFGARFDETDDEEKNENDDSLVLADYEGEDLPTIEWNREDPQLAKGTVFQTMMDCRNAITTYHILTKNNFEVIKSEPDKEQ
ncbi:hypothetical protein QYE76_053687 [Lolium multiflorum]|uniref:Uncharacterized protein n=1 Tax=Lolium multiflorum TaxID=4521 RepID=A0AAD8WM73_LOLMU|nr:hypothetical protein QYE76_053687 [Lolium multiflorum]